jgi:hypothetical protein
MVEVSSAEALWLLEVSTLGRLVHAQRDLTVLRPARHLWEYRRLVIRTPAPVPAMPETATYHADEIRSVPGTDWTVTVCCPVEVISDRDAAAQYRRTLSGWSHGPHDTLLRLHPKTVAGFRLARPEA